MPKADRKTKGFTLLEVIVAIFLITVGIGGIFALINQNLATASINSQKLVATYLAQEGIELVRSVRDGNWLEGQPSWLQGNLSFCSQAPNIAVVGYNFGDVLCPMAVGDNFCLGNNGFYFYGPPGGACNANSVRTPYVRTMYLYRNPDGNGSTDDLRVQSRVAWTERGRSHTITAEEILYDWR